MPKHFLLAGWYPRELTVYQQSYRSSDSNHVSAEALTAGRMTPLGTNSPPAEVSLQ
jgi:hypothetical protein